MSIYCRPHHQSDDVLDLIHKGHLVTTCEHRDPNIITHWAGILFEGLERLRHDTRARDLILEKDVTGAPRDNKDALGRLHDGYFEKIEDDMQQLNIADISDDGHIQDYHRGMPTDEYENFFKALCEVHTWARVQIEAIAAAIDAYRARERTRGNDIGGEHRLTDLLLDARILVSATSYRAHIGTSPRNGCRNTAALAIYCLVTGNVGRYVIDRYGREVDLSHVEKDPKKIVIVPGEELSLVTNNLIDAATNPVYPETEGQRCATLRVFVYLSPKLLVHLRELRHQHMRLIQALME